MFNIKGKVVIFLSYFILPDGLKSKKRVSADQMVCDIKISPERLESTVCFIVGTGHTPICLRLPASKITYFLESNTVETDIQINDT